MQIRSMSILMRIYLQYLWKLSKRKIIWSVYHMKGLNCSLQCINLCSRTISVKKEPMESLALPQKNLFNLQSKILLPYFSQKIGKEKNIFSMNLEISIGTSMVMLYNSIKLSNSSSRVKTAQELSFKFSLNRYN